MPASSPDRSISHVRRDLLARVLPLRGPETLEWVPTRSSVGRIVAERVTAKRSVPHYRGAAMDGIAARTIDLRGADPQAPVRLQQGSPEEVAAPFAWIDTGGAMPPWADCVVMREHLLGPDGAAFDPRETTDSGRALPKEIYIGRPSPAWQHVRQVGEDVVCGDTLVYTGERIRPVHVGALLAAGVRQVPVRRQPVVAILPTGSEIRSPEEELPPGAIPEFNSSIIAAQVAEWGGSARIEACTGDDLAAIQTALTRAAAEADIVCVIAGSSAGRRDFTFEAMRSKSEILARGVDLVPGRPAIVAIPSQRDRSCAQAWLGIPGYPVSAVVICTELLEPLIKHLLGVAPIRPTTAIAHLAAECSSKLGVEELLRVRLSPARDRWLAIPLPRGAGSISTLTRADGILRVPREVSFLGRGERVTIELLRPLTEERKTLRLTGEDDPILELLADHYARCNAGERLLLDSSAATDAVAALVGGDVDGIIVDSDLLPTIERHPDWRAEAIFERELGWVIRRNDSGIRTLLQERRQENEASSPPLSIAVRPPGYASRVGLERVCRSRFSPPGLSPGGERLEPSDLLAAAAVASHRCDAAFGPHSVARLLNLEFIPVLRSQLVLLAPGPVLDRLIPVLHHPELRREVSHLDGVV